MLGFLRRNVVMIVSVGMIASLHYGWYNMQFNEMFVPKDHHPKYFGIDIKKEAEKRATSKSA
jgi:hypothetical protein